MRNKKRKLFISISIRSCYENEGRNRFVGMRDFIKTGGKIQKGRIKNKATRRQK